MRLGAIDVGTEGDSIKSPVTWVGNKSPILHILYAMFPEKHDRYIEPFGGSCAVLLGKREKDKFEVYNDYNHNLTNLFRVMIFRPNAFKIELGFCHLNARDFFEEWKHRINMAHCPECQQGGLKGAMELVSLMGCNIYDEHEDETEEFENEEKVSHGFRQKM